MNAQGIERAEIMGDWYEELARELEAEEQEGQEAAPELPEWTDEELEDFSRRCRECGNPFDDNPDETICKTCEDWIVTE